MAPRIPSYVRGVPIRPGGVVQGSGFGAFAGVARGIGALADNLASTQFEVHARKVQKQAAAKGARVGMDTPANALAFRTDDTLAGEAFNRAALETARLRLEVDASRHVQEIADKYQSDPAGLREALDGAMSGIQKELPEELMPDAFGIYSQLGDRAFQGAVKAREALELDKSRAALLDAEVDVMGTATRLAATGDYAGAMMHLDRAVAEGGIYQRNGPVEMGGTGALSLEQIAAKRADMESEVLGQIVTDWTGKQGRPEFVLARMESGRFGDPLVEDAWDRLSADAQQAALNKGLTEVGRRLAIQEAQRAETDKRLRSEVGSAVKVMRAGYDYDGINDLRRSVKGTEFEQEIEVELQLQDIRAQHAQLPVDQQIKAIEHISAGPQNETRVRLIEALKGVTEESTKAVTSGRSLEYARDHKLVEVPDINLADPESWSDRMRRSDQAAAALGVPKANLLTERETSRIAEFVGGLDAAGRIEWLASMRAGLGDDASFGRITEILGKEKVAPGLDLAADLLMRGERNQPTAFRLLQAMEVDEKALPLETAVRKEVNDGAAVAFSDGVGGVLAAQASIAAGNADLMKMASAMATAHRKLALTYQVAGNGGGDEAYADLFGDYGTVWDDDVILMVDPAQGDADEIADGLRRIRRDMVGEAVAWAKPGYAARFGNQADLLWEEYVTDLQEGGVWINGPGGAVLVDPVSGEPVGDASGNPYTVTFEEARKAAMTADGESTAPLFSRFIN
jgi:hypothetical protein